MTSSVELALGVTAATLLTAGVLAAVKRRARRRAESLAYLKGVRYVLSDSPDAAIGELTRAAELNAGTSGQSIETYFALGKLFRRKGNLERAIRLHHNILLRPGLAPEIKREAQFELAIDLQRAGLLSRAIEAFERFLAEVPAHPEALLRLRQVHESNQDLEAAAEVQVRAVKAGLGGEAILAHLLAAAARVALPGDRAHAQALAEGAVTAAPKSVDAHLVRAQVALESGHAAQAAEALSALLRQAPESALEVEPLLSRALADPAQTAQVFSALEAASPALRVALSRALLRAGDRGGAATALREALALEPGYAPARRELGALLLASPLDDALKPAFEDLLRALEKPELEWVCGSCRFAVNEPIAQCPRCNAWDGFARQTSA